MYVFLKIGKVPRGDLYFFEFIYFCFLHTCLYICFVSSLLLFVRETCVGTRSFKMGFSMRLETHSCFPV